MTLLCRPRDLMHAQGPELSELCKEAEVFRQNAAQQSKLKVFCLVLGRSRQTKIAVDNFGGNFIQYPNAVVDLTQLANKGKQGRYNSGVLVLWTHFGEGGDPPDSGDPHPCRRGPVCTPLAVIAGPGSRQPRVLRNPSLFG